MFYVSISTTAIEKVKKHAGENLEKEVIGLLTGHMKDSVLIIEDAVTGEMISEKTRASLPPESIAKIADQIINKKVKGNVVGWYHSHPGFGVFISDIDMRTQIKLQQFSPYIVALIIDPTTNEIGFFTVDTRTKSPILIKEEYIHIFETEEDKIPTKFRRPIPEITHELPWTYSIPIERLERPPIEEKETKLPTKKIKFAHVGATIALIACILIAGLYIAFLPRAQALTITVSPESIVTYVGKQINITADILGGLSPYNCTWYQGNMPKYNETNVENRSICMFEFDSAGTYQVYVNITDRAGTTKTSKNVTINILPLRVGCKIESPRNGSRFPWGSFWVNGTLLGDSRDEPSALVPIFNESIELTLTWSSQTEGIKSEKYNVTTNYEGNFDKKLEIKEPAKVNLAIKFKGNATYGGISKEVSFELTKRNTNITIDANACDEGVIISGQLRDEITSEGVNGTVICEYLIDGEEKWEKINQTNTDAYGNYSMYWNPDPKGYTIRAKFDGNYRYNPSTSKNFTVSPNIVINDFQNLTSLDMKKGEIMNLTVTISNMGLIKDNVTISFQYRRVEGRYEWENFSETINLVIRPGESITKDAHLSTENLEIETGRDYQDYSIKVKVSQKEEVSRINARIYRP